MKKKIFIIIFVIEGIAFILLKQDKLAIPCLFKSILNTPCPGCGMTRAFKEIIKLHFVNAFKYNILSIPLFIIIIIINLLLLIDIIKNTNRTKHFVSKLFSKPFIYVIVILFILSAIKNI